MNLIFRKDAGMTGFNNDLVIRYLDKVITRANPVLRSYLRLC